MNTRTIPAQISAFQALLLAAHPTATIELDEPGDANGTWMIDLRIGKLFLAFSRLSTLALANAPTSGITQQKRRRLASVKSRAISWRGTQQG
jgi:hypothetical protein